MSESAQVSIWASPDPQELNTRSWRCRPLPVPSITLHSGTKRSRVADLIGHAGPDLITAHADGVPVVPAECHVTPDVSGKEGRV